MRFPEQAISCQTTRDLAFEVIYPDSVPNRKSAFFNALRILVTKDARKHAPQECIERTDRVQIDNRHNQRNSNTGTVHLRRTAVVVLPTIR